MSRITHAILRPIKRGLENQAVRHLYSGPDPPTVKFSDRSAGLNLKRPGRLARAFSLSAAGGLEEEAHNREVDFADDLEDRAHDVARGPRDHQQKQEEGAILLELMEQRPRAAREEVGQEVAAV